MKTLEYPEEFLAGLLDLPSRKKGCQEILGVTLSFRGNKLFLEGEEDHHEAVEEVLEQLFRVHKAGSRTGPGDIKTALQLRREGFKGDLLDFYREGTVKCSAGRTVFPKGLNQGRYLREIREKDLVFGIGPAGTGKTYLAVAMAVSYLKERRVKRLLLTRPAVEAGERLGFLPGDLVEKVNPYLRPLYDALYDLMEVDRIHKLIDNGVIEVAPIAFMRGRTFNDSFIILDEAQNTTIEQMKMFLTRMGFNCKAVVTGDVTQIDIDPSRRSGLVDARDVLRGIDPIGFTSFTDRDVVRHPLVQRIILAYERAENGGRPSRTNGEDA